MVRLAQSYGLHERACGADAGAIGLRGRGACAARMRSRVCFFEMRVCSGVGAFYPVIASAAKQSRIPPREDSGLLRRFAPRNDGVELDTHELLSITHPKMRKRPW